MKKITIFLACSNELLAEREQFEREIYRKCKLWFEQNIFLHLEIWEDLSARMSLTRSQDEYNKEIQSCDLFVLLAGSKVGMYTAEEFNQAFGAFQGTKKPFIYTYFKQLKSQAEPSLQAFKDKLATLGHFYSPYVDFNDLWQQFNKELDRLALDEFKTHQHSAQQTAAIRNITQGSKWYPV